MRIANRDRDNARIEAAGWKALYDQDHAWRVKQEERMDGTLIIYIPWWLIGVLAALAALSLVARLKRGVFNPFALFTKK